jgi:hypothetical protein
VNDHTGHIGANGTPKPSSKEGEEDRLESALVIGLVDDLAVPHDSDVISDEWGRPPLESFEPLRDLRTDLQVCWEAVPRGILLQHSDEPIADLALVEEQNGL